MANASLPTRTDGSFGQTKSNPTSPTNLATQASAVEWNAIADALIQLIGQTWQTVSANGTTVVADTTDVASVTATGAVTLTPPTTYTGRRVRVLKAAAAVGGITWTGVGALGGSTSSAALVYELEYDGSSWRLVRGESNARLVKLGASGSYLSTIQTVSTASATVSSDVDLVLVTYSGGTCALTFGDSTDFPTGRACVVQKANTGSNGITVVSDGATAINGGTAGASMTLPSSTTASSTTTADPAWLVQRTGTTDIRVS